MQLFEHKCINSDEIFNQWISYCSIISIVFTYIQQIYCPFAYHFHATNHKTCQKSNKSRTPIEHFSRKKSPSFRFSSQLRYNFNSRPSFSLCLYTIKPNIRSAAPAYFTTWIHTDYNFYAPPYTIFHLHVVRSKWPQFFSF